jgi:hypothetical protein
MRREEWDPIARRIAAAWPEFGQDPATSEVYFEVLEDVDARAVDRVVGDALREGRENPPPPGVLRDRALGIATTAGVTQQPSAPRKSGTAWIAVLAALALIAAVAAIVFVVIRDDDGGTETTPTTVTAPAETVTRPQVITRPAETVTAPPETVTSPPETGGSTTP